MPTATLTFPDNSTATLEYPEGMPEDQVMQKAMLAKQQWMEAHPKTEKAAAVLPTEQNPEPTKTLGDMVVDHGKRIIDSNIAGADLLKTVITGAIAQPVAGLAGLAGILLPGEENQGTRWKEATESALTADLWTDAGKRVAGAIGEKLAPVEKLSQGADDFFNALAGGNPAIATAFKTGAYAVPEIFLGKFKAGGKAALQAARNIGKQKRVLRDKFNATAAAAEKQGYKLSNDELGPSIVRVAENLAPEKHAAANIDEVAESVIKAKQQMKNDVDALYTQARSKEAYTMVRPVQDKIEQVHAGVLEDGFDVGEMPLYRKRLEEARNLSNPEKSPVPTMLEPVAAQKLIALKNLNMLERRVTLDLKGKQPGNFTAEDAALLRLRNAYRDQMDHIFNNAAIYGDKTAVEAWKKAGALANRHRELFKEDKVIRDLVQRDASPEQMYSWIMGASSMGAKKQAGATLTKLKEILGDNHPSLVMIRNAAVRDVVMPALADIPNYNKLISNIDRLLNNNPTIVKELNIPANELVLMKKAALAAKSTRAPAKEWMERSWLLRSINRVVFGHQIARSGAIVQGAHKITDAIFKTGALTREELVRHMMDLDYDQPLVMPKGPLWTEIMVMGAVADASDETEIEERGSQ